MSTGTNLKHARLERGWTLEDLSERSGVEVGTISALENRDSRRSQFFGALAEALGCSFEDLVAGRTSPHRVAESNTEIYRNPSRERGIISMPVMYQSASAGPGSFADEYVPVRGHIDVVESWALQQFGTHFDRVKVLPVRGDSMHPTIDDGDLLFVDTAVEHFTGDGIYILAFNETVLVKRLVADPVRRHLEIRSDNPAIPTQTAREEEIQINGIVRLWWKIKRA